MCLLLVKAGGNPEKWRSHGQKRKPFSESEWIVIPELLPVIQACFFLCHVVCSAVIFKRSTSTSTFHFITVPKRRYSFTVRIFPSKTIFQNGVQKKCERSCVSISYVLYSLLQTNKRWHHEMSGSREHTVTKRQEYTLHFFSSHFIPFSLCPYDNKYSFFFRSLWWIDKHKNTLH